MIDASGNVGIATSSPSYVLDVLGAGRISGTLVVGTPTAASHAATKSYVDTVAAGGTLWTRSGSYTYGTNTGDNFGIGTATPSVKLDVTGDITASGGNIYFETTDVSGMKITAETANNDFQFLDGANAAGGLYNRIGIDDSYANAQTILASLGGNSLSVDGKGYFGGNVGIGTTGPIGKLQIGNHTFGGGNGVFDNSRIGAMVNGSLTSIVYASTYNDPTYPDYGLVFIHGPTTANYNVWSISPDGPARGDSLSFIYGSNAANIHTLTPKVVFDGSGDVGIGDTTPSYKLDVTGTGQFTSTLVVGTPTASGHAATKSYVDTVAAGGTLLSRSGTDTYVTNTGDEFGIGTAGPTDKLHVYNGRFKLSSNANGGSVIITEYDGLARITAAAAGGGGTVAIGREPVAVHGQPAGTYSVELWSGSNGGTPTLTASGGNVGIGGTLNVGGGTAQSSPLITARSGFNNLEFGHGNQAGYGSTLGYLEPSGKPFLAFHAESVGSGDYYRTRGIVGRILQSDLAGGLLIGRAANSNATNQSLTTDMIINGSGNIGIGTSPSYKLDVSGTGNFSSTVVVGTPTIAGHAATKNYVDTVAAGGTLWTRSGSYTYGTNTGDNFGIGTATPGGKLTVNGGVIRITPASDETSALVLGKDNATGDGVMTNGGSVSNAGVIGTSNGYPLVLGTNNTGRVTIDTSGNVGIGTTGPAVKLDVAGDFKAAGVTKYTLTRSSTGVVGDWVEIGKINTNGRAYWAKVTVEGHWSDHLAVEDYEMYATYYDGGLSTSWVELPIRNGKGYYAQNQFAVDARNVSADGVYLRVRNKYGATFAGTLNITVETNSTLTQTSGSGSAGTVLSGYLGNNVGWQFPVSSGQNWGNTSEGLYVVPSGSVSIGTTSPSYKLDVQGTGQFTSTLVVGTPTASGHAATKNYVDTVAAGGTLLSRSGSYTYMTNTGDNFGIGTATPGVKLSVAGAVSVRTSYGASDSNFLTLGGQGSSPDMGSINFGDNSGWKLHFGTQVTGTFTPRVTFVDTGNVGIGTTGPAASLQVGVGTPSYAAASGIYAASDIETDALIRTGGIRPTVANGDILISDDSGSATRGITIQNNGNIGIGTSPSYKLDVSGTGQFTSTLVVGTPTASGHAATKSYVDTVAAGGTLWTRSGTNTYVTNTGDNVGIGTASPLVKLRVAGDVESSGQIRATGWLNGTGTGLGVEMGISGGEGYVITYNRTTSAYGNLRLNVAGIDLKLDAANSEFEFTGGNVGIGTASPLAKLHVTSDLAAPTVFANADYGQVHIANTSGVASRFSKITFGNPYASNSPTAAIGVRFEGSGSYMNFGTSNSYPTVTNTAMTIDPSGYVGINNTGPGYRLDVSGTAQFSSTVIVGTPTSASHAATKSYVDSAVSTGGAAACNADSTCEMNGANLNNGNITGVNKLTVTTLDPVYEIGGVKYATFGPSFAGGVKEEYTGRARLVRVAASGSDGVRQRGASRLTSDDTRGSAEERSAYEYVIDFSNMRSGSDLWLWYKAVDFGRDNVEAIATPYGSPAVIYYEIRGTKMIFRGDAPAEFSFRLTGKRHDWRKWPTLILDQGEKPSFILQ